MKSELVLLREEKSVCDASLQCRTEEVVFLKQEHSTLQESLNELSAALKESKKKEEEAALMFESQVSELCVSLEKFKVRENPTQL